MGEAIREIELETFAKQNEALRLMAEANYGLVSLVKQKFSLEGAEEPLLKMKRAEDILAEIGE